MTPQELIERLEKAEDYDPLLNVAIWRAVDPEAVDRMDRELSQFGVDDFLLANNCEDFTGSLDAALTLVPEGWIYELWATNPSELAQANAKVYFRPSTKFGGEASTAALALCIACLIARAKGAAT